MEIGVGLHAYFWVQVKYGDCVVGIELKAASLETEVTSLCMTWELQVY